VEIEWLVHFHFRTWTDNAALTSLRRTKLPFALQKIYNFLWRISAARCL
jgi:hypothetical protein